MITMKALIAPGVLEGVLVQGGKIELPCKYFVLQTEGIQSTSEEQTG